MDKIYKIPKYNKELYLGGTLMKDLKNFVKPILFLTIGLLLISLVKNIDFMSMMTKIQNNMQQGLTVVKITDEKSEIKDDNLNKRSAFIDSFEVFKNSQEFKAFFDVLLKPTEKVVNKSNSFNFDLDFYVMSCFLFAFFILEIIYFITDAGFAILQILHILV